MAVDQATIRLIQETILAYWRYRVSQNFVHLLENDTVVEYS